MHTETLQYLFPCPLTRHLADNLFYYPYRVQLAIPKWMRSLSVVQGKTPLPGPAIAPLPPDSRTVDPEFPTPASSLPLALVIPNTSPSRIPPVIFLALAENRGETTRPLQNESGNRHLYPVLIYAREMMLLEDKSPAA